MKQKLGLAPGTLIYTGRHKSSPITTDFISYNTDEIDETTHEGYKTDQISLKADSVNWINLHGLYNQEIMTQLGQDFNIHNLALEDALNTDELPKFEEFDDHLFFSLKMLAVFDDKPAPIPEHISLVLGKNYLITLQEKEGDVFEGVRNRIRLKHGKIRSRGNDYLLYALLDTIVDNYFLVLDAYQNKIDSLEQRIFAMEEPNALTTINGVKKELILLRKYILPLELAVQEMMKFESRFITESISHFFHDLKSHLNQITLQLNEQRESLKSLTDLHISLLSNEMNQIMKVLTIVASIFIPLTFLAGIYGMNFEYIPELKYRYGYFVLLGIMATITFVLIYLMKRKKWL